MRTTSIKTIYLTEAELKEAISDYLRLKYQKHDLANHLDRNYVNMEWSKDKAVDIEEFIISMDGEFAE